MKTLAFFSILALSNAAATTTESPVTKIVGLITEMKDKIIADGKAEQMVYDKYACWCETTTARKAQDIHTAMSDIKSLGTKILEIKSQITSLSNDISHISKEMSENQAAQDEATALRTKENAAYSEQKAMMEQTLQSLQGAITVLSGAGTKTGLLQAKPTKEAVLIQLRHVAEVLNHPAPSLDRLLTPKQLRLIRTFAKDPAEFYDQKAQKAASYNPASSTIMGILKDMYDTFSSNLEDSTESEAVAYKNYESLMGVKTNEMATLAAQKKKKEEEKATAEQNAAETAQEYDDTIKQMKADTEFFDDSKASCQAKADEWSERVRARTEELSGINKALEILTSDDAKALFNKSIKPGMETMFLQVGSNSDPQMQAYKLLKARASETGSLRLMSVAAELKARGMFDGVVEDMNKMIDQIALEGEADHEQKDWCKEEMHKNEQEAARYEYKIEKVTAKLMRLQTKLEELESTLQKTYDEIKQTKEDLKEMTSTREADHAAFKAAKADDEGAVGLLENAIAAMSAFYKNNKAALLLLEKQPVFDRGEQAPDATFSKASKSSGEAGGILSIMTMLKEDLQDEISNGVKMEKDNQFYFERTRKKLNALLKELDAKKINLKDSIVDTNKAIDNEEDKKGDLQDLLDEEHKYLASITPDCNDVIQGFDEREKKRVDDTSALIESRELLKGMPTSPPESLLEESPEPTMSLL